MFLFGHCRHESYLYKCWLRVPAHFKLRNFEAIKEYRFIKTLFIYLMYSSIYRVPGLELHAVEKTADYNDDHIIKVLTV